MASLQPSGSALQVMHDDAPCPVALVLLDVEPEVAVKLVAPVNQL